MQAGKHHNQRWLFLNDNLGVVLALEKGRARCPGLMSSCRRMAAHSVACGIFARVRWVASELNPSDHDSRLWQKKNFRNSSGSALNEVFFVYSFSLCRSPCFA